MSSYLLSHDFATSALTFTVGLALFTTAYTVYLIISRLYFSPISHIPGPKLAAATWWYDFYYQVVQGGKFYKKIAELHKQYGE